MSHWCLTMVDCNEFWISCKGPAFLSSSSHLQMIQNLAPPNIVRHQCDIQIVDDYLFCQKTVDKTIVIVAECFKLAQSN